jgi:hypothetical protein
MNSPFPFMSVKTSFCQLLLVLLSLGICTKAAAQNTPPRAYDFLTVMTLESGAKALSRIFITPAFEGKSEIQLEDFGGLSVSKNMEKMQRNTLLVNQQLTALTVGGWEIVQVYPVAETGVLTTRYLFRKPR